MKRLAFIALALVAGAASAEATTYGNPEGCELYSNSVRLAATDTWKYVTPTEVRGHEETCYLPQPADFSGKEITVTCEGEAMEWAESVSLTLTTPDALLYKDESGEVTLNRCD